MDIFGMGLTALIDICLNNYIKSMLLILHHIINKKKKDICRVNIKIICFLYKFTLYNGCNIVYIIVGYWSTCIVGRWWLFIQENQPPDFTTPPNFSDVGKSRCVEAHFIAVICLAYLQIIRMVMGNEDISMGLRNCSCIK